MRKVKKFLIDNEIMTTIVVARDRERQFLISRILSEKNKNCICLNYDFFYHKLTKKFYSICCEEFRWFLFVYEVKYGNIKEID